MTPETNPYNRLWLVVCEVCGHIYIEPDSRPLAGRRCLQVAGRRGARCRGTVRVVLNHDYEDGPRG